MSSSENPEPEYQLVVPFVEVQSKGGRYEDNAFVAGFQMGTLWTVLLGSPPEVRVILWKPIYSDLIPQADLIAMKEGWKTEIVDEDEEWATLQFVRSDDVSQETQGL